MCAILNNSVDVARFLLDQGAESLISTQNELTAMRLDMKRLGYATLLIPGQNDAVVKAAYCTNYFY